MSNSKAKLTSKTNNKSKSKEKLKTVHKYSSNTSRKLSN